MKQITFKTICMILTLVSSLVSCSSDKAYGSRFDEIQILERDYKDENLNSVPSSWIQTAGITQLMVDKAEAYRSATHNGFDLRNGIYVYSTTVNKYASEPEKLAARIAVLGFRDVYLSCGKSMIKSADNWLRTFISICSDYNVKVYATRIADVNMLVNKELVKDDTDLIKTYNYSVRTKERFAGIAADLEPHIAKGDSHPGPALPYTWDGTTGYGVGRDNDNLLKRTLAALEVAHNELHPALYLNEAIAVAFQSKNDSGDLSYGSVPQFLTYCDYLVVMAYFADKENIWSRSLPSIQATEKEKSVSICVKTAMNNVDSESLQGLGWNNLLSTLAWIKAKGLEYPSFRGLDIFTYEGIETMWEWTSDTGNN